MIVGNLRYFLSYILLISYLVALCQASLPSVCCIRLKGKMLETDDVPSQRTGDEYNNRYIDTKQAETGDDQPMSPAYDHESLGSTKFYSQARCNKRHRSHEIHVSSDCRFFSNENMRYNPDEKMTNAMDHDINSEDESYRSQSRQLASNNFHEHPPNEKSSKIYTKFLIRGGNSEKHVPRDRIALLKILTKAANEALKGGISGAVGGAIQVITLMWLRTTVNYQCRYGGSIFDALSELYKQGGITRFYQGISYAIVQGPLSKFGSVAANEGAREILKILYTNESKGVAMSTALGSVFAALWRIILMPIDTCKTVLQVEGNEGFTTLMNRVFQGDILQLYQGTAATVLATIVGHYPWFLSHNWLDGAIPKPTSFKLSLLRNALIGFISSAISDICSNVIRVIKTVKQSSAVSGAQMSYYDVIIDVYHEGGLAALFGRGLPLRIITNGIQSMLFVIVWKIISSYLSTREGKDSTTRKQ